MLQECEHTSACCVVHFKFQGVDDDGIFQRWLLEADNSLREPTLLLLDNATSHNIDQLELRHLRLLHLPANTTPLLQPLDLGIIQTFKLNYRKS